MINPLAIRLADEKAERVRQSHASVLTDLMGRPGAGAIVIPDVLLPNSQPVMVSHSLGRAPRFVGHGIVRVGPGVALVTSGTIVDFGTVSQAGHPIDRTRMIQVGNFNFGQDLTVDLWLVP